MTIWSLAARQRRFINSEAHDLAVRSGDATAAGGYSTYIALGDSYSSANGVANDGTVCASGDGAWPYLLRPKLTLRSPSKEVVSGACSGATTAAILGGEQGMAPQIDKVTSTAPQELEAALITITIGGNDIGVSSELLECGLGNCLPNEPRILENIASTRAKLIAVYKALREAAPKATIVAVGYPHLVAETATIPCSDLGVGEIDLAERTMIRNAIDVMNETIRDAAKEARIYSVVDEVVAAFEGREACASKDNDFIHAGNQAIPAVGWFHQNAAGNQAYSEAVLKGLSRLAPDVPRTTKPVRNVTLSPVPTSPASSEPTATTKQTAGSASTLGSIAEETDHETDPESEADSDEGAAETEGEEDDPQDPDGEEEGEGDEQAEDGPDSEGDDQDEDGSHSGDDEQEEDESEFEDDVQEEDG